MQHQYRQKSTAYASTRSRKPDRFAPLLAEIRSGLRDHWTFYEECIDGVLDAAARQHDTTAWFEQMQQLVAGVERVQLSHEGILFFLRDMGIPALKQQRCGEREKATLGMYHSPPLSPPEESSATASSSISSMEPEPVPPTSSMNPPLSLRPLRPSTPSTAVCTPSLTPMPRTHQQQTKEHQPIIIRGNVLPFDSSATVLPELTFPENLRGYYCPRDEITLTEDYVPPPPNPLRKTSRDPVFFSSPMLKTNIVELFGQTLERKHDDRCSSNSHWQAPPVLPYNPSHDDLVAWKQRSEGGTENEHNKVEASSDTQPPWNSRLDLEI